MKQNLLLLLLIFFIFSVGQLQAQKDSTGQESAPGSTATADLALVQAAANPIANMITLPFQFNFNFGIGENDRSQTVLNMQPVLPFKLTKTWNVITRTIIPLIQQPMLDSVSGSTYGIGNTNFNAFFVPPVLMKGVFTYGFGVTLNIPTANAPEFGGDAFGLGPTAVFLFMPGNHWVAGATAALTWAYKSPDGSDALNSFFAQYFITYNIKKGWFVNTTPTITANFNAPKGEQWIIPTGAGFGKVQHFKRVPMKFMLQYYYNVAPTTPSSMKQNITVMIMFMFPKKPNPTHK